MNICDVITKHFMEFSGMVRNTDTVIEEGNTYEDIFSNVMLTALKKFKGDVDETEACEYIKKTLLLEFFFSPKRKRRDILIFTDASFDNIPDDSNIPDNLT